MATRYIRSSASTAELKLTVSIICAESWNTFHLTQSILIS